MTISPLHCSTCRAPVYRFTRVPPSPIPHLLGTNKVPSTAEAQSIRALIAAARSDISHLDAGIARAQHVLAQLIKEREALKVYVDEHAAFLTPARRMPDEIWSEIFLHCLPTTDVIRNGQRSRASDQDPMELTSFGPGVAPALLLRVCRDWAFIALSSPRLWSLIDLGASSHYLITDLTPVLIQTWLTRSQQAPLTVMLSNYPYSISSFENAPARAVLAQSHRWRVANMQLWHASMDVFLSLRNNLPELEELQLQFQGVTDSHLPGLDIFGDAPKLRRVTIHGPPQYPFAEIKLPWAQLTHFSLKELDGRSIHDLSSVLQLAPDLLEVEWTLSQPPQLQINPSEIVQHPRLRDLSVFMWSDPGSSFDCLDLPSLRRLSYRTSRLSTAKWSWSKSEAFIVRNGQALQSFQLDATAVKGSELVACLGAMPALSELRLSFWDFSGDAANLEELIRSLCYTGAWPDTTIVQALSTITIDCHIKDAPNIAEIVTMFIDMVESRWQAHRYLSYRREVSHLRWASLNVHGLREFTIDQADEERLERLNAEGLAVEVSYR